nr:MAG: RNA-dependent RNA polymerase [Ips phenui-like virus 2]
MYSCFLSSITNAIQDLPSNELNCPVPRFDTIQYDVEYPIIQLNKIFSQGVDWFEIEFMNEGPQLTDASVGSTQSILDKSFYLRAHSVAHEFTFDWLINDYYGINRKSTDVKLSFIRKLNDNNDAKSPDCIYAPLTDPNHYIVVEFATCDSANNQALMRSYNDKRIKYLSALQDRMVGSPITISYFIIVIGIGCCYTNLPMDDELKSQLCGRMSISAHIIETARNSGFGSLVSHDEESITGRMADAKKLFQSIGFNWDAQVGIEYMNEEVYRSWMQDPVDINYCKKVFETSLIKANGEMLTENKLIQIEEANEEGVVVKKLVPDLDALNKDFLEGKHSITRAYAERCTDVRREFSTKSIVPIPFWPVEPTLVSESTVTDPFLRINWDENFSTSDETLQTWVLAYNGLLMADYKFFEENYQAEFSKAMEESEASEKVIMSEDRNKYRRVIINLDAEIEMKLAQRGIRGKKHKLDPEVVANKEFAKVTFPLDCHTQDVDELLTDSMTLFSEDFLMDSRNEWMMELVMDAQKKHNVDSMAWSDFVYSVLSSRIGVWCTMVSDIAFELSLSMRQNCSKNQFVLKKLRNFPIFILIKSTGYNNHLFYSLLCEKKYMMSNMCGNTVFKKWNENENLVWTEFNSIKAGKISNLLKAESTLIEMAAFWVEFYKIPFFEKSFKEIENAEFWKMLTLSLIVSLENKSKTEEVITMSRFICMEGFVRSPSTPKPHKMMKKLGSLPLRSRLQAWFVNKLIIEIGSILRTRGYQYEIKGTDKIWLNMRNPFTGHSLSSPWHLVSLFYLGYLKDKNESFEKNSSSALYGKILEYEDKLGEASLENLTFGDPHEPKFHEFSSSLVKLAIKESKKMISKKLGPRFENRLEKDMLREISQGDLESFASLKASSNFDQTWYTYNDEKTYSRQKVISAVCKLDKSEDDVSVYQLSKRALEHCESNGGLHVCLFKKNQHGGLREIYVLGVYERVIQYILEHIARSLCNFFESETMTHPGNKTALPDNHTRVASKLFSGQYITAASSDDAQKWNQGHFVTKFALLLCSFTPSYMHPFIIRSLGLFLNKKIMIDNNLMKVIYNSMELMSEDAYLIKMFNAFKGKVEQPWMSRGEAYITTKSGMMQGILHYTSSLFHSVYLELYKSVASLWLSAILGKAERPYKPKVLITSLQSSDDSSILISYSTKDEKNAQLAQYFVSVMLNLKHCLGNYFGIYKSVKCTMNTEFVMEFNSEFYFDKNHVRPALRWVTAALTISQQESIAGRQEELATNLTSVVSGGCSFSVASLVQWAQAFLHYRILGSSVAVLFEKYKDHLLQWPDPASGYFLMDNPFAAGLCGFQYNLWKCCKDSTLGRIYKLYLNGIRTMADSGLPSLKTIETTYSGAFVGTSIVAWGDRKKWKAILEDLNLPADWASFYDEHPSLLFARPRNKEELDMKLAMKMHSPGVTESLSSYSSLTKIIASSAYLLSRPVVCDSSAWFFDETAARKKRSLLKMLITMSELGHLEETMTLNDLRLIFPFNYDFVVLEDALSNFKEVEGYVSVKPLRKVNTKIELTTKGDLLFITPTMIMREIWFGHRVPKATQRMVQDQYNILKASLPWLRTDPIESLEESPFTHMHQLHNFLSRLDRGTRVVMLSGAPVYKTAGKTTVLNVIKQDFFPGFNFSTKIEQNRDFEGDRNQVSWLKSALRMCCAGPFTTQRKEEYVIEILRVLPDIPSMDTKRDMRRNKLRVLQQVAKMGSVLPQETIIELINSHYGLLGAYTMPQYYNRKTKKWEGRGRWTGTYCGNDFVLEFFGPPGADTYLTKILVSKVGNLHELMKALKVLCARLGIYNEKDCQAVESNELIGFYYRYSFGVNLNKGAPVYLSKVSFPAFEKDIHNFSISVEGESIKLICQSRSLLADKRAKISAQISKQKEELERSTMQTGKGKHAKKVLPSRVIQQQENELKKLETQPTTITVFTYVSRDLDVLTTSSPPDLLPSISTEFEKAWYSNTPLDGKMAYSYYSKAIDGRPLLDGSLMQPDVSDRLVKCLDRIAINFIRTSANSVFRIKRPEVPDTTPLHIKTIAEVSEELKTLFSGAMINEIMEGYISQGIEAVGNLSGQVAEVDFTHSFAIISDHLEIREPQLITNHRLLENMFRLMIEQIGKSNFVSSVNSLTSGVALGVWAKILEHILGSEIKIVSSRLFSEEDFPEV